MYVNPLKTENVRKSKLLKKGPTESILRRCVHFMEKDISAQHISASYS